GDMAAGVSGCLIMIPSVIAYARLIGLPPESGLFAALIPLVVYPFFTTSPQVIVGPDIAICLLMANAIGPLAGGDPKHAATLAAILSLASGALLLLGSRLKLGRAAVFLSKPVLVGYMTGAALILVVSQLRSLLGFPLVNNDFFPRLLEAIRRRHETHLPTLFFGLGLLALIVILRRLAPKVPGAIIACLAGTAISAAFHLEKHGIAVVGRFEGGLPTFDLPVVPWHEIQSLLPAAFGIAFLAYTEGILLARAFAAKNGYDVAPNQELTALGAANLCNGLFEGFPVTGSQSRTTINDQAGGRTQMASLVMAACVALFLLFLTPLLAPLPSVTLAAILIFGGWNLVEFQAMKRIYQHYPAAAGIAALTTLGVLAAGVVAGILLGVILSLLTLITRISHPPDAVLREVSGHGFHDVGETAGQTLPGLLAYRFYAPLLFSNCDYFSERVHHLVAACSPPVRWLLLDAQAITDIDVTAVEMLHTLHRDLANRGVAMKIAHANRPLRALLDCTGLEGEIGEESFFASVHECVQAFALAKI
ncbi:MAG TPA: SulP family inorganic anion transporter, partial [Candidatus Cybelea sp.]|nr:SulP family inorganic anion transporter [Candidatus Cybelea sp.]